MSLKTSLYLLGSFLPSAFSKPWIGQGRQIRKYWSLYGGWKAFFLSPYTQASAVMGIGNQILHVTAYDAAANAITIMPNVLGFTIGALSIILAFSSSDFFVYLTQKGKDDSLFMKTIANFVHFIIIQVSTLMIALITTAHNNAILQLACSFLLVLSLSTAVSIVVQLFQMATVFNLSKKPPA